MNNNLEYNNKIEEKLKIASKKNLSDLREIIKEKNNKEMKDKIILEQMKISINIVEKKDVNLVNLIDKYNDSSTKIKSKEKIIISKEIKESEQEIKNVNIIEDKIEEVIKNQNSLSKEEIKEEEIKEDSIQKDNKSNIIQEEAKNNNSEAQPLLLLKN